MTLLVADIGNTQIKLGLFEGAQLVQVLRLPVNQEAPQAFISTVLSALANFPLPDALVYCSVVPHLNAPFKTAVLRRFPVLKNQLYEANPQHTNQRLLDIGPYPPDKLGPDRWVNLYGAERLYPQTDRIVIDFGTATTVDLLSREGCFYGGAIVPGFETFNEILSRKTASLPPLEQLTTLPEAVGQTTQACLLAGSYFGYLGMLKEILAQAQHRYPDRPWHVLATGGLAERLAALYKPSLLFHAVHVELTLLGLHTLYQNSVTELTAVSP